MGRIQWARASQFNWVFDNMGGTPLMAAVHGNWTGTTGQTAVAADGKVYIKTPMPGGGVVYYLRGVWKTSAVFPWNGFWAEPESGDLTNYYTGGSFVNQGAQTVITLGTGLAAGTEVQVYYIHLTGEKAAKYEALNSYPCIRPAFRERGDYTFDFAVDRILDLMAVLDQAGRERGRDYSKMVEFLWEAFYPREASLESPLILDTFERGRWDRGSYLLYYNSTLGLGGFKKFAVELYPGDAGDEEEEKEVAAAEGPRALRVILNDYTDSGFSAWWGYGMNWSLTAGPFSEIDQVRFKLRSNNTASKVRALYKTKYPAGGSLGSAKLIVRDSYTASESYRYVLQITTGGEIGAAEFTWKRYNQQEELEEQQTGIKTAGSSSPISLGKGISIYWEPGEGNDFEENDYWSFWVGDPEHHPRRLQVILNDSEPGDEDPWGAEHSFIHAVPDRYEELTEFEVDFNQFWRIDNVVDDRDRRRSQWGYWRYIDSGKCLITLSDREETETILGEIFYTQRKIEWQITGDTYAFGVWTGINTAEVDSTGRTNVNFLINPSIANVSSQEIRVKVKDANGNYFYKDETVTIGAWQRVSIAFADFTPENAGDVLTHPVDLIDIGIASDPPDAGIFLVTDIKFDEHVTFADAGRLRLLEFKYYEIDRVLSQAPAWWLDDVGVNLEAGDDYPYAPRLAISLSPYGQNAWRGPTLVHYAHPLGPYLVDRHDLKTTYLQLHRDAQDEYHARYGGVKGPVMPVHTRNDIENIALCGEENFGKFCWWPKYRDYGKVVGVWHFNEALSDASGKGHTLTWKSGQPSYTTGICQPGNTSLKFDGGAGHFAYYNGADFLLEDGDFTLEAVVKFNAGSGVQTIMGLWSGADNNRSWLFLGNLNNGRITLGYSPDGIKNYYIGSSDWVIGTTNYHHAIITRKGDSISIYVDGQLVREGSCSCSFYNASTDFQVGANVYGDVGGLRLNGNIDYARVIKGYALNAAEAADRWQIIKGQLNGSAYPEVGSGLAQYWAFYRLAEYYFRSNDPAAGEILENWVNWLNAYCLGS